MVRHFFDNRPHLIPLLSLVFSVIALGFAAFTYYKVPSNAYDKVMYHLDMVELLEDSAVDVCKGGDPLCDVAIEAAEGQLKKAEDVFISERSHYTAEMYEEISLKITRTKNNLLTLDFIYGKPPQ